MKNEVPTCNWQAAASAAFESSGWFCEVPASAVSESDEDDDEDDDDDDDDDVDDDELLPQATLAAVGDVSWKVCS